MFDWLRKAAQGVGNFIYNSTPAGGALRTVNRTINRRDPRLQQQQQQIQQRQVPQAPPPPRINLPKINLNQANSILNKLSNPFTIPVGNVVDKTIKGVNDLTQPQIRGVKNFVKPNPMGIKSIGFEPTVKDINTGQVVANPPSVGKRAQIEPRIAGVGRRAAMPVNNKSPVDNFLSGLNMAFRQATGQKLASDQEALLRRSPQANAYFKFMPRPEETANAFISMNPIWSTARDVKNQGLKAFEFQNVLRRNNPLQGFADINSRIQRDTVKNPFIQANSQQGFNKKVLELNTRASDNSKQFISDVLNKVVVQGGANLPGVKQVRQTAPGKFVGENIADPMLKFYIDTLARVGGTGTGQRDAYAGGIQGWGQGLTDITNVGSLAYTGAKAGQLAAAPLTQALKLAPGVFGRQALANSGANVLNQFAEGKKYNQIDPIQVAGAGILGGALGTGIPLGGKILGKGISKVLGRGATKVDLNTPITVKTYVEKGKLLEQGYKNVKIKFNGATHKIQNDGVVTELAPKGIKGVKIDKSTQEAVDAGALSPKLAQQGYKVTPDLEIIAPNGKKLSIGEIQQLEQASALTKAEQKIAQGQETYGEAEALTKQLGKQPARIADDFNQPRSPNGRYGNKEFNPELEQLKAYQTEQLQVLQRANQNSPEYRGAMDNYNVAQKRIDVLERPKTYADNAPKPGKTDPLEALKQEARKYDKPTSFVDSQLKDASILDPRRNRLFKLWEDANKEKLAKKQENILKNRAIREKAYQKAKESQQEKFNGYGMSHRPTKNGATADDITKSGVVPKDVYTHPHYYTEMDASGKESFSALSKIKGKPDAEVTIYRASPKSQLNEGDWVTLSKSYAKQESLAEGVPVNSFKVKAKDIQFAGDSLNEFGYFPKSKPSVKSKTLYETVPKGTFDKRPKGKIEEARSYIENALAKNLKQYHKEFGGVAKLARESDVGGGMDYSRQSMNPKWYRKFYEDNGRAPTKQDYLEIARSELKKGSPDARAMLGDDVVDTYVRSFEPPKPNRVYKQPKNVEKKRGFVQTVQDSEFTEQPTRVMLDQSDTFTTKSNKLLEKKANEMITADVTNARAYAMNNTDDQAVATAGQLIKYYQAKKDFGAAAQIADDVAHRLTEAGRTIQAASLYNKLNPEGILQYASSKVQKAGKTLDPQAAEVLTDLAKKIEKMADGEDKQLAIKEMMDIIGRAKGSAISDKVITLWKSGLLTSPVTTAGNLTSNTFKQIVKKASDDPIAAVTDMMFSVVTGKRTKTFTGRGLLGGAGEGSVRGIKYFKTGYDIRNPIDKLDSKQVYFSDSWAGKVAQTYSDSVFRLMGAQDQPYFYAALRNTLYDQALAAAKNQGVKGQARDQFIKKFVNNTPSDIMDVATEEARQAVFQNKTMLSSIASKINQSDNTAVRALGQFLMPFSKVPSAVATEIFDRTPLGAAKEIVKQVAKRKFDQRAMSNAIAKSTTGTVGIMGLGYALDRGDSINLAFPQSETERNLWELEGRQPFSVKVGDKWISLNYVQPFGSLIAMGAQYHRSLKDGGNVQDALASSAAMGAKAVTEQSFLRGVGGALGALQDPARQAERYVEQTAGSVIPNFIRTTARATDPVQRQINNAGEAVIAGVPGLRQTLLPKQNVFGQEIARADSPLGTMINPFRPTTAKSDPTIEELRRLYDTKNGVLPSELDKSAFGKDKQITPAQINELQASVGQPVLERWQKIMADYRYKRLSDEDKAKVLKDARDAISRGEKYAFAQDNGLGDTKLDRDSVRYLEGNEKDYLARDLPKRKSAQASSKPKRVAKAKKGRKAKVGRIAKSSAPKLRSIKLSAGKVPKISRTAKVKFRRYA